MCISPDDDNSELLVKKEDGFRNEPSDHLDEVLTNPPFGKKSSITQIEDSPWPFGYAR